MTRKPLNRIERLQQAYPFLTEDQARLILVNEYSTFYKNGGEHEDLYEHIENFVNRISKTN